MESSAPSPLPKGLSDLVHVIGKEASIAISKAFGGKAIRIPSGPESAIYSDLVRAIEQEHTQTLCRELGRVRIYISKRDRSERANRDAAIRRRFDQLTATESGRKAIFCLVDEFGLSDRRIEIILGSM